MTMEEFLALPGLNRVRRSGDGWKARCPTHEDKDPSLTIDEGTKQILVHCHAGCPIESVLSALGIEMKDLFFNSNGKAPHIAATYPYFDENRQLLYESVRYEPKAFKQRRPDGQGGWTWNLKGVRRVLYHLPELIASTDLVVVVEGEKDVESASALGLTATCNPGGAGKWRDEYSEFLCGKMVAVIVDADDPGRKHSAQVAASLYRKAAAMKVTELPGAKDLSEWVAAGGTREQLLELLANVPAWMANATSTSVTVTDDDAVNVSIECELASAITPTITSWIWRNRIPLGKLTVVCGVPDVGKSAFAIDVIARGTTGKEWPDCENTLEPFHVLMLIAEDDTSDTVVPRLMAAGANLDRVHIAKQTVVTQGARRVERRIALDTDLAAIEKILVEHPDIKLVVIDPLASYLGKLKKNTEEDVRTLLVLMKDLAQRRGVAVVTLDHFNKNIQQAGIHRLSGAGALAAVPRAVWSFVKDPDDQEKLTRLMLNVKLNIVSEKEKTGLRYRFATVPVMIDGKESCIPVMQWLGATSADIDGVLQTQSDPRVRRSAKAAKFLEKFLAAGARRASELFDEAAKEHVYRDALFEAKKEMAIQPYRVDGVWWWELSQTNATVATS